MVLLQQLYHHRATIIGLQAMLTFSGHTTIFPFLIYVYVCPLYNLILSLHLAVYSFTRLHKKKIPVV